MGLRLGPRGVRFLISEVPLWTHCQLNQAKLVCLMVVFINQLWAQRPSRTCMEGHEEEEGELTVPVRVRPQRITTLL